MRSIKFPDMEQIFVQKLNTLLAAAAETNYRVATNKLPAGQASSPAQQVIIRSEGGVIFDKVFKEEEFTILLWTDIANKNTQYIESNRFSNLLEALIQFLPKTSWECSDVSDISVAPIANEGSEELKEITFKAIIKGADFDLSL